MATTRNQVARAQPGDDPADPYGQQVLGRPNGMRQTAPEQRKLSPIEALVMSPAASERIAAVLPKGITLEVVAQELFWAAKENPELTECTPASLVRAVCLMLPLGLVLGRTVYLVPFRTKVSKKGEAERHEKRAQMIVGYNGKVELAIRAQCGIRAVEAECVYEGDHIEMQQGTEARLLHRPAFGAACGRLIGAYAIVRRGFGATTWKYMPLEDIEAVRRKSIKWGPKYSAVCPPWYGEKTVVNRVLKLVPQNPRFRAISRMIDEEERAEFGGAVESGDESMGRALSAGSDVREDNGDAEPNYENARPLDEYADGELPGISFERNIHD